MSCPLGTISKRSERAAGRQGPALGGDPLGLPAQLHFLGEQALRAARYSAFSPGKRRWCRSGNGAFMVLSFWGVEVYP
jgi:hypothetical protein